MPYALEETLEFRKRFDKLSPTVRGRFEKQMRRLARDPYGMGKPLGKKELRELKQGVFRLYYLISDKRVVVLLLNVSDKDTQRQVIESIRKRTSGDGRQQL